MDSSPKPLSARSCETWHLTSLWMVTPSRRDTFVTLAHDELNVAESHQLLPYLTDECSVIQPDAAFKP